MGVLGWVVGSLVVYELEGWELRFIVFGWEVCWEGVGFVLRLMCRVVSILVVRVRGFDILLLVVRRGL